MFVKIAIHLLVTFLSYFSPIDLIMAHAALIFSVLSLHSYDIVQTESGLPKVTHYIHGLMRLGSLYPTHYTMLHELIKV